MRFFIILLLFTAGCYSALAQCSTPIITASGPAGFCAGGTLSTPVIGNTWTQKADFGGVARVNAVGFSIGSKGYVGTGYDGNYKKDFWEFDPSTNAWTQKADFGGSGRYNAVGFSIGNKGYVGTGRTNGGFSTDFWEYDPATNVWIQKADFGGVARVNAVGFSIGSKGYAGTGTDASGSKKDFWEYNPSTNAWTQKADFGGFAKVYAVGFSIGSKGYVGTGLATRDFWEYDPATNVWTQRADVGGSVRSFAVGFSIGNKGYVGTGNDGTNAKKDFWEYDPSTNSWTQRADFGGGVRNYAVGFSIGSKGYMGTGSGSGKDFWEYDPGYTYSWSPGGQTTPSIIALAAGNYTVTATNVFGCSATSAPATVNATPAMPAVSLIQPTCTVATGTITVNTPTGTGIMYRINNTNYQSGSTFNNVAPGNYSVTAINGSGCMSAAALAIINTQPVTPATPIITTPDPTNFCAGGTLSTPVVGNAWAQKADFGAGARAYAVGFFYWQQRLCGYRDRWQQLQKKISGSMTLPRMPGHRRQILVVEQGIVPLVFP